MPAKASCDLEGVTVRGLLGARTLKWSEVAGCVVTAKGFRLLFRNPHAASGTGADTLLVPKGEVAGLLLSPSFRRWLVDPGAVKDLRLEGVDLPALGPPPSTTWVERETPILSKDDSIWLKLPLHRDGLALSADRVGLFSDGVAFRRRMGDLTDTTIIPWWALEIARSPTEGYYLCHWREMDPKVNGGLDDATELSPGLVRALLSFPSGKKWSLPEGMRTGLGPTAPP